MTATCPHCKSTEKPDAKRTVLKGIPGLLVFCGRCGAIFAWSALPTA